MFNKVLPEVPLAALVDETTFNYGEAQKWLNGIDIYATKYSGSIVQMAKSINASIISPIHGFNINNINVTGRANQTGYYPFTTKGLVDEANYLRIVTVPWTIDDAPTITKVLKDGVDGVISNYPILLRQIAEGLGYILPPPVAPKPYCRVF